MKKFVLAPDSFKGTMSSQEICNILEKAIHRHFTHAEVLKIAIADGGEGTIDSLLKAVDGEKIVKKVKGPYFSETDSFFAMLSDRTAVVETAAVAGLPMVENNKNPELATTYGLGELIRESLLHSPQRLIIALGGSATNDGGCGMAAALGVKFTDKTGKSFVPTGKTLCNIDQIDCSGIDERIKNVEITAMCDVKNPLCGREGAAFVFAPQKGADEEMVKRLDMGLLHLSEVYRKYSGYDLKNVEGVGAAGGLGFGSMAFLNARLSRGIDVITETVKFRELIEGADMVITGEGRIDAQSLDGKAVMGIGRLAKEKHIPCIAVVGEIGEGSEKIYDEGITAIFSILRRAEPFSCARLASKENLSGLADNIMRFVKSMNC